MVLPYLGVYSSVVTTILPSSSSTSTSLRANKFPLSIAASCSSVNSSLLSIISVKSNPELNRRSKGIAYKVVKKALQNNKHVITANKAMLAVHGNELSKIAEQNNVCLNYEAAIAGGIPIVKAVRENLRLNKISKIYGILNGTCNYILTKMENNAGDFKNVLNDAQKKG